MDKALGGAARNVHEAATDHDADTDWGVYGRLWVSTASLGHTHAERERTRFATLLAEIGAVAWARHLALWPDAYEKRGPATALAEAAERKDPVGTCYEAVGRLAASIDRVAFEIRMRDKKTALRLADVAAVAVRALADLDL